MKFKLEDVFGVSAKPVLSYISRGDVDDRFIEAIKSDKQIVIYGSSKQGKTSLVNKYLPYEDNIVVRLTPRTSILDIYQSILRQLNIRIEGLSRESSGKESNSAIGSQIKASIPIINASIKGDVSEKLSSGQEVEFIEIPVNLELPQDISELIRRTGNEKFIILENFHYLDDERQKAFAFDLRTFQELGIHFIILGVWREKNRLIQFNGDLLDRIIEIPVEPWLRQHFTEVVKTGQKVLNVTISEEIINLCIDSSFNSIGVFQELLKEICSLGGVLETKTQHQQIEEKEFFYSSVRKKADEYASRHQRALESIAAGHANASSGPRDGLLPLYLPYYLVKVLLAEGYDGISNGMRRQVLHERIQAMHHRKSDVRASDMSNLLYNIASIQASKSIVPPIIDYDRNTKMLQIVDSTFYFFLRNADLQVISEEIPNPLKDHNEAIE